jgi:hypothetical protein
MRFPPPKSHYKKFVILRHFICNPWLRTVANYTFATVIATVKLKGRRFYNFVFITRITMYMFWPNIVTPTFPISFSLPHLQNPKINFISQFHFPPNLKPKSPPLSPTISFSPKLKPKSQSNSWLNITITNPIESSLMAIM